MKKLFICSGLGMMFFMLAGCTTNYVMLAGCTTNYVMTTKNGQTIVTQGKPQLDKETGMTRYTDQEGNQREINSNDVAQLIKAD
ncbi:YgdI/YgdR family lipoprotein [Salmonella enterica subsp. diarizonae]|nr:YgdI/YgdR family lipoprotein [Salmonella enterica subsp. diarizonae]